MCINDFLNVTCKCSPSILLTKPKFHYAKEDKELRMCELKDGPCRRYKLKYLTPEMLRSSSLRASPDEDSYFPQWRAVWVRRGRGGVLCLKKSALAVRSIV
jgi:hypothetical protein